jgi:hypothetical protein
MILYHRTNREAARNILRNGFRDTSGFYMTTKLTKGVWFSEQPLDVNEGAKGATLFRIRLRISRRELDRYEWVEEEKPYREWQIPAALVNARRTSLQIMGGDV